jgi:hypothetical protein
MRNETAEFNAVAAQEGFSTVELRTIVEAAKTATAKRAARKPINGARAELRPQWKDYKGKMTLPEFVMWAYAVEHKAGTLCKATLHADSKLYAAYFYWRRKPDLPSEHHWLRNLPTQKIMTDRRLAGAGIDQVTTKIAVNDFDPETQNAIRLYHNAVRRAQRARRRMSVRSRQAAVRSGANTLRRRSPHGR